MSLKTMMLGTALAVIGATAATAETWSIAVTDVEGLERLQAEWGPFKTALEAATGETFDFFPVSSRTASAEALRGETIDFVITGPAEYIVINTLTKANPLIGFGRPDYRCAIIVRADAGIDSMDDLKGKKVAFGDIGSTSNMLCPMQLMADYGVSPVTDIEAVHTARNIAHEALKAGDVAAIGINEGSWIASARDKDTSVPYGFFKVLARSGDLPNDMLLAGAHVPTDIQAKVRDSIIANKAEIIAGITAHEENGKYIGMDLVTIEDAGYDIVRSMYTTAGYPQFDKFLGE
ncbi:phosphate/phosphite/phosphonate ABC transporter substrate-binding protein [Cypionkella sp.]|uniref:phosphate/phosphite/phosphonate ABC transporter substrate-binding protein n=1 Tax=Cypionkella sp. TaxID=2811411 RepID=UPI002719F5DC|nr:PhnD/SsuA/transferrin family substrate-binding protein [Cypionkella sp.]MDO8985926.1 PhnD/SsuA/transferrin family substrate-binding protein [Cypionkella sp.]MDP2049909.1 PhnD/SsuA/transferrin family substrate-binding protein [Cypionkella sp.]